MGSLSRPPTFLIPGALKLNHHRHPSHIQQHWKQAEEIAVVLTAPPKKHDEMDDKSSMLARFAFSSKEDG
jgi:hypothetical protein